MRKNIFLHFMNRDTREIFDLYRLLPGPMHAQRLREPLNAAVMLCESQCIAPPGFVIEDQIAFELFENQAAYLEKGVIRLPIREASLADYAEKKRDEYAPVRDRYSGLYNDTRMQILGSYGEAILSRKVHIGPAIIDGFQTGVDTNSPAWKEIREKAPGEIITNMREIPTRLANEGKALTWSIMEPNLDINGNQFHKRMRGALQHVYFNEYCKEFKLFILSSIPNMIEDFHLPTDRAIYNFKRFKDFLDVFSSSKMFLRGAAEFITAIRDRSGFIDLMDSYASMASRFRNDTDLKYHAEQAVKKANFQWHKLAERREGSLSDPTNVEILEIADACEDLASTINTEYGFITRSQKTATNNTSNKIATPRKGVTLKVALFVALEEELEVLVKHMNLDRQAGRPAAVGKIGEVDVEVLCPRGMGRVAAAIETTRYLAHTQIKPNLIICVGLAGGFKVNQGGVICVDTVIDLANRKVTDTDDGQVRSKFRSQEFHCSRVLYSVAKSKKDFDEQQWSNECRDNYDWDKGTTPALWEGRIASVDEVVASTEHQNKLMDSVDKLLGVEMEAGGVCAAAKEFKVPFEVLRVVSDKAGPDKADDKWRKVGMKTLAELLMRLPLNRVIEEMSKE